MSTSLLPNLQPGLRAAAYPLEEDDPCLSEAAPAPSPCKSFRARWCSKLFITVCHMHISRLCNIFLRIWQGEHSGIMQRYWLDFCWMANFFGARRPAPAVHRDAVKRDLCSLSHLPRRGEHENLHWRLSTGVRQAVRYQEEAWTTVCLVKKKCGMSH